ncbi:2-oxo acid dehydrogenase subunit E2 [SAR202 cluster bacterium AD-804-J14_MRT_500m]|nr:2-oxo acid dehydrogenase subunit E2 [SAR202 cluster bacterium AD-804-J14_MRT_500m]
MPIVPIELPHVGETVVEGIIDKWLRREGDRVKKYEPLVEVITDKVNMEVPSPFSGVLTKILAQEGNTVAMGSIIAEMNTEEAVQGSVLIQESSQDGILTGTAGILIESSAPVGPTGAGDPELYDDSPASRSLKDPATTTPNRYYSPVVTRIAGDLGVNLEQVTGSGANGRVTKQDVVTYARDNPTTNIGQSTIAPHNTNLPTSAIEQIEVVNVTPVRRLIAHRMARSSSEIPHAWAMVEVDVTGLVELRSKLKEGTKEHVYSELTLLPFVIAAVAQMLKLHPNLNASWQDDKLFLKRCVNVGIAVSSKDGLVVPVIRNADSLQILEISQRVRALAKRGREGTLTLDDVQGGTFTVNNTGALGTILSGPIINYPQAGILTTELVQKRPIVIANEIVIRSMMNICLSFDHRILDGLEAALFLRAVQAELQAFHTDTLIN